MRYLDARASEIVLPEATDGPLEFLTGGFYQVSPLRQVGDDGETLRDGVTLWLHWRGEWYWDFFSYRSDVWAWVTDAQTGGNPIVVDRIEAYARHDSHYGLNKDVRLNSSIAHAHLFVGGVAVGKSGVCGSACAEKMGYSRWCAAEKCF